MLTTVFSFKARDLFPQTSHCKGMLSIYQYFFPEGRGGAGLLWVGFLTFFWKIFFYQKPLQGAKLGIFLPVHLGQLNQSRTVFKWSKMKLTGPVCMSICCNMFSAPRTVHHIVFIVLQPRTVDSPVLVPATRSSFFVILIWSFFVSLLKN